MHFERASLDHGFARTSVTLLRAWSLAKFTGAARAVLDQVVIDVWAKPTKDPGYQSKLTKADLHRLLATAWGRTTVFDAVDELLSAEALIRGADGFLAINPEFPRCLPPERFSALVAMSRPSRSLRESGDAAPPSATPDFSPHGPPEPSAPTDKKSARADGGYKVRARGERELTSSSSDSRQAQNDDDEKLKAGTKSDADELRDELVHWLARRSGKLQQDLEQDLTVNESPGRLAKAYAQLIVGVRDERYTPQDARRILLACLREPDRYPKADVAAELAKVRERKRSAAAAKANQAAINDAARKAEEQRRQQQAAEAAEAAKKRAELEKAREGARAAEKMALAQAFAARPAGEHDAAITALKRLGSPAAAVLEPLKLQNVPWQQNPDLVHAMALCEVELRRKKPENRAQ